MPTLHERFADLAEDAPRSPTPSGIWADGRRRTRTRRVGTAVLAAATVAALLVVGGYASHRSAPRYVDQPGAAPALPSEIHHPSPWLSGTGDTPPGRLSVLIPGKRGGWPHYHWGMVGVSATTGAYHYLEIPGCYAVDGLSPDGLHVSCFTAIESAGREVITGIAIYDTVTGHVDRWAARSGRLALNSLTWNGNDEVAFRAGGTSYLWSFGQAAPHPIATRLTLRVGVAGTAGLYLSGRDGFFYLRPAHARHATRILVGADPPTTTPAAVSSSGRRIAVTSTGPGGRTLLVGDVTAGHRVRLSRVPAALRSSRIVGWADRQHVLVVNQVSGSVQQSDAPASRFDLDRVDVVTGEVVRVARMSDQQTSWGTIFATSLLGTTPRDFPAPPQPINQRLELGIVVGVLLAGGLALVLWRRRVRA